MKSRLPVVIILALLAFLVVSTCYARSDAIYGDAAYSSNLTYSLDSVDVVPEMIGGLKSLTELLTVNQLYPRRALEDRVEGMVEVEYVVSEAGRVEDIKILQEEPRGFDFAEAAKKALKAVAYVPGTKGGEAVRVKLGHTIKFSLENDSETRDLPEDLPAK